LLRELEAGGSTVGLEGGDIRYFRPGGREVVRRIYVAVRNVAWETPRATVTSWELESHREGGFEATYRASVTEGDIAFEWTGKVELLSNGQLTYSMNGRALSSFDYARIGVNLLHPPSLAGCPFSAMTAQGPIEGSFPAGIGPQPLIDGEYLPLLPAFSSLAVELGQGVRASFDFEGDVFEFDDQSNWLDASYKSYSTPMSLGLLHADPGQPFFQQVRVTVTGPEGRRGRQPVHKVPPRLELDRSRPSGKLPSIGLGVASGTEPLTVDEQALLRRLALDHLRVDLHLGEPSVGEDLTRAAEDGAGCGSGLEIALFVEGDIDGELALAKALTDPLEVPIRRFLVFGERTLVTPEETLRVARQLLGKTAPVFGGTNIYFAELNRDRPDPASADGFAFSVNPQVHSSDDRSLMEAPPSLADMLRSARDFLGGRQIAVGPITLLPRFNPDVPEDLAGSAAQTPPADHRQASLLCAGWTLECATYLAEGGARSVTFFETTGDRGVIAHQNAPTRLGGVVAGARFPVYHLLEVLGQWAGMPTHPVVSTDPLAAFGLACSPGDHLQMVVANATAEEMQLELVGLPSAPCTTSSLNAETVTASWAEDGSLSPFPSEHERERPPRELTLAPYGIEFLCF